MPALLPLKLCALGALLAIGLIPSREPAVSALECLRYEPDTIVVRGVLRSHVFPGLPNYESIAGGDDPEEGFYLHLGNAVCFDGDSTSADAYPQQNVDLIQLNLDSIGFARLAPYLHRTIAVRGRAYAGHSGHHHAPVVLWFDKGPL